MGEISVLDRLIEFCKNDMQAFSLHFLFTEFVSISKILVFFQSVQRLSSNECCTYLHLSKSQFSKFRLRSLDSCLFPSGAYLHQLVPVAKKK